MKEQLKSKIIIVTFLIICSFFGQTIINFSEKQVELIDVEKQDEPLVESTFVDYLLSRDRVKQSLIPSNLSSFSVWGQPMRITVPDLEKSQYTVAQDTQGRYHIIWVQEYTTTGISLMHTYSSNSSGLEWTSPNHILRLDASIENPLLQIDENNTLHLVFTSTYESFTRVYYCFKNATQNNWEKIEPLVRTTRIVHESFSMAITNSNTLHLAWVTAKNNKFKEDRNSSITYLRKSNGQWQTLYNNLHSSSNPILVQFRKGASESLQLCWTNWSTNFISNYLFSQWSYSDGISWNSSKLIATSVRKIAEFTPYRSSVHNGTHYFWRTDSTPYRIKYLEQFANESFAENTRTISNPISSCYFGGFFENKITGDIFVVYEEDAGAASDLYYIKREYGQLEWEERVQITNNQISIAPTFIGNKLFNNDSYGVVVYLSANALFTQTFLSNTSWINKNSILKTTNYNQNPSLAIDSIGTKHLVWKHKGQYETDLFYMQKTLEGSWHFVGGFTNQYWSNIDSPRIAVDSNDTVHCVFIALEETSELRSIFHMQFNQNSGNWSEPILLRMPTGEADQSPPELIIDENDMLHVVWTERFGSLYNRLLYASKTLNAANFTSNEIIVNDNDIFDYNPSLAYDSKGTLHLVYTENTFDIWSSKIIYRYKEANKTWSSPEIIAADGNEALEEPLIAISTNDTIEVVFQHIYPESLFFDATDIHHYQKQKDQDWIELEQIVTQEIAFAHELITLSNGSLCYVYHQELYPEEEQIQLNFDFVFIKFLHPGQSWTQEQLLFFNPKHNGVPLVAENNISKQLELVLTDRRSTYPMLTYLTHQNDVDNDFLGDQDELIYGTKNSSQDSDQDQLSDGIEVILHATNPSDNDTDWDFLIDGDEISSGTNPLVGDTDSDKLLDGIEVNIWGTNPLSADSDSDNIEDYDEIIIYGTNPNSGDTDLDLMPDFWEITNELDPLSNDSQFDVDSDNLVNLDEYLYGTDPNNPDCDNDSLLDGDEVTIWNTDPLDLDSDNDTITDSDEVLVYHTNPLVEDSDGDGFTDREEINAGTDPNDPKDNRSIRQLRRTLLSVFVPITSIAIFYSAFELRYRLLSKRKEEEEADELAHEEEKLEALVKEKSE